MAGALAPVALSAIQFMSSDGAEVVKEEEGRLLKILETLGSKELLGHVGNLLERVPNDMRSIPIKVTVGEKFEKMLESAHNYVDYSDIKEEIVFEGATKVAIEFDSRSATEGGCDWLKLYVKEQVNALHATMQLLVGTCVIVCCGYRYGSCTWFTDRSERVGYDLQYLQH